MRVAQRWSMQQKGQVVNVTTNRPNLIILGCFLSFFCFVLSLELHKTTEDKHLGSFSSFLSLLRSYRRKRG